MAKSITIRDIEDDVRDELAARAASTGRSLQEYLHLKLTEMAQAPDAEVLVARIRNRKKHTESSITEERILLHRDAGRT